MTLSEFNLLNEIEARAELFKCCGSTRWSEMVAAKKPFNSISELKIISDVIWNTCVETDWLEAFTHHPKIGDKKSLEQKFAATAEWAANEQSGVNDADKNVIDHLAKGNEEYENKFGYIFIVCASGKTAYEMLDLLNERVRNTQEVELKNAAAEQNKITNLRIDKLFS